MFGSNTIQLNQSNSSVNPKWVHTFTLTHHWLKFYTGAILYGFHTNSPVFTLCQYAFKMPRCLHLSRCHDVRYGGLGLLQFTCFRTGNSSTFNFSESKSFGSFWIQTSNFVFSPAPRRGSYQFYIASFFIISFYSPSTSTSFLHPHRSTSYLPTSYLP